MATYAVEAVLTANAKQLVAGFKEAQGAVSDFKASTGKTMGNLPSMMGKVGSAMTKALTVPIIGGFGASAKVASDFQSAMTGVAKTTDLTGAELDAMGKAIRDMALEVPATTTEIAGVAEAAGQLGIEKENIVGFSRAMIDMGEATNMTAEEAATAFARFANITQLPQSEIENLASTVVELGNNFATTESEIVQMGMRLAGTGAQVGLTQAEIMGLATAMSSVGIQAEAGGSAMSRVMQKINTEVLSSGKNLQGFAKVAGMSAQEFSTAWRENPTVAIEEFVKGLKRVQDSGGDVTATLKELGINGIREVDTLSRLAGAGNLLGEAFDTANNAFEENTALSKEASLRYETFASKVDILKNALGNVGIAIGSILLPVIEKAVEKLTELAQGFTELSPGAQTAIVAIAGFVAILGPALLLLSKVPALLGGMKTGLGVLKAGLTMAGGGFTKLAGLAKGAFGIIMAHPFLALAGIVAIAVGLIIANWGTIGPMVTETWELIKTKASEVWQSITEGVTAFIEGFKAQWEALKTYFSDLWTGLTEGISEAFNGVKESILMAWEGIKTGLIEKVASIKEGVLQGLQSIVPGLSGIWEGVKSITQGAWDFIKNVVIGAGLVILQVVTGDIKGAGESAKQIWENLKNATKQIWDGIKQVIKSTLDSIKQVVSSAVDGVKNTIKSGWDQAKQSTIQTWNNIKQSIKQAWDNIKQTVTQTMNNVKQAIQTGWTTIKTTVSNAVENIKTTVSTGFTNVVTTIKSKVNQIPGAVREGFSRAISAAKTFIGQAVSVGAQIINGFVSGVKSAAGRLISAVGGAVQAAINWGKRKLGIRSPSRVFMEIGDYTVQGLAKGLTDNASKATKAMDRLINPLTGQEIDIGSNLSRMGRLGDTAVDYVVSDRLGDRHQSIDFIFKLGNRAYKGFVDDISRAQGKEIELVEAYGY